MADEWDDALETEEEVDVDGTTGEQDDAPEPKYPSVEAFVTGFLAPLITQEPTRDDAWCPEWWQHPEGILRLESLWRSWEHLRLDGTTGMSVWLRDHRDPHMGFLFDRSVSPFARCSREGHKGTPDPLPVVPAPPGTWDEPDDDE